MKCKPASPVRAGLLAARANLLPGLLLQVPLLSVVLAYYLLPEARPAFETVAEWKASSGYFFSFAVGALAGGLLPELLRIISFQKFRIRGENWRNLLFTAPFWGFLGICVDALYRLQASWFGSAVAVDVVVKKVLFDQFIYNSLFAAPFTVGAYEWRNRGFRFHGLGRLFSVTGYANMILPTLIATWGVWIPAVSIVYSLPPLLQIPLFGFALSFWVLIVTTMNVRADLPKPPPEPADLG